MERKSNLVSFFRWLDRIQKTRIFHLAASVVAVAACVASFGPLALRAGEIQTQRVTLARALENQNLDRKDPYAVSIAETGTVTVEGRIYGGPHIQRQASMYFDPETYDLAGAASLVEDLLADQRPAWAPGFLVEQPVTTALIGLAVATWFLLIVWMDLTVALCLTLAVTAIPVAIGWWAGRESIVVAFSGMGLLTFTFVLLTRAVLILCNWPAQPLAVAHTVVKEATRRGLSLSFVVVLLIALPLLPLALDPNQPLRFRIQTFISWSLGLTYATAACMTIFLACSTVAFEIRDRQIWQLMTKPLTRINYLLGKWLGVIAVDLVILLVAGVSIFAFTRHLARLPVAPGLPGILDRIAVDDEVLIARAGAHPGYDALTNMELVRRVEALIRDDPEMSGAGEISQAVKNQMARELQESHLNQQRTIEPGAFRAYVFRGLGGARELQSTLTLRYRFHIMRDDEHERFPVAFIVNGDVDNRVTREYIPTVTNVLPIGPDLVRPDGTLEVAIQNLYQPPPELHGRGWINFEPGDFELLYRVGGFETNFVRAMAMTWVKLAFLAMLGIVCATLLNFPVACLFTFTIFFAGTLGPFLAMALQDYQAPPLVSWSNIGEDLVWLYRTIIRAIAQTLVFMLSRFGEYRPTQDLVEGRLIPWARVVGGVAWLGVVWSGACLAVGWLSLRRRQLAIYSGHGA